MKNMTGFLLALLFLVPFVVGIFGVSEIQQERAEVAKIFRDVLREMKAEGYLSAGTSAYYEQYLRDRGYEQSKPYFRASHTDPNRRAVRPTHGSVDPSKNEVMLTIEVEPKPFIKGITFLREAQPNFIFTGTRLSDYIREEGP